MITSRTVRFRNGHPTEQQALQHLHQYREFGFQSGNELIIAAINEYCSHLKDENGSINLIHEIRSAVREEIRALPLQVISETSLSQPKVILTDVLSEEDEIGIQDFLDKI